MPPSPEEEQVTPEKGAGDAAGAAAALQGSDSVPQGAPSASTKHSGAEAHHLPHPPGGEGLPSRKPSIVRGPSTPETAPRPQRHAMIAEPDEDVDAITDQPALQGDAPSTATGGGPPVEFKSIRSLGRSFGVKRRDSGSQEPGRLGDEPDANPGPVAPSTQEPDSKPDLKSIRSLGRSFGVKRREPEEEAELLQQQRSSDTGNPAGELAADGQQPFEAPKPVAAPPSAASGLPAAARHSDGGAPAAGDAAASLQALGSRVGRLPPLPGARQSSETGAGWTPAPAATATSINPRQSSQGGTAAPDGRPGSPRLVQAERASNHPEQGLPSLSGSKVMFAEDME